MDFRADGGGVRVDVDDGKRGRGLAVIRQPGGTRIHKYLPAVILDARLMGEADADEPRIRLADQLERGGRIEVGAQRDGARARRGVTEGDADLAVAEATLRWERPQPLDPIVVEFVGCPLHRRLQPGRQAAGEAREARGVVEIRNGDVARPRGDECTVRLQLANQVDRLGWLRTEERMVAEDRDLVRFECGKFRHDRLECGEVAVYV